MSLPLEERASSSPTLEKRPSQRHKCRGMEEVLLKSFLYHFCWSKERSCHCCLKTAVPEAPSPWRDQTVFAWHKKGEDFNVETSHALGYFFSYGNVAALLNVCWKMFRSEVPWYTWMDLWVQHKTAQSLRRSPSQDLVGDQSQCARSQWFYSTWKVWDSERIA